MLGKLRNRLRKSLLKNNRGQGATEYILLVAVVVGLVMMFKKQITTRIQSATDNVGSQIDEVTKPN